MMCPICGGIYRSRGKHYAPVGVEVGVLVGDWAALVEDALDDGDGLGVGVLTGCVWLALGGGTIRVGVLRVAVVG